MKYARARIPHYWRVENHDGRAVVYVFELEPADRRLHIHGDLP